MAQDEVTEVTTQSLGSNLGSSIKGALFGFVLILGAFVLLWWNEGRTVEHYKTLREGLAQVVEAQTERIDPAMEKKLIHVAGKLLVNGTLTDADFGITTQAVRLKRTVSMYQWVESKSEETNKQLGGSTEKVTTYRYAKEWSEQAHPSKTFKNPQGHDNPAAFLYAGREYSATDVQLGTRRLSEGLIQQLSNFARLEVTPATKLPAPLQSKAKLHDGGFFIGQDPQNPAIGDLKVSFQTVNPESVSVIAKQRGNTFEPFTTYNGPQFSDHVISSEPSLTCEEWI
ncbi:MAG: TMEM43 family protein [Magnetococcales bacterium]|nr:TMEM43 family protein [Magnetococcales bacterium]